MNIKEFNAETAHCMTVEELIDELNNCSPDAKVFFQSDYGDYHHTQQLLFINGVAPIGSMDEIIDTAYSDTGLAVVDQPYNNQLIIIDTNIIKEDCDE
jgi:hypothetical protein